MIQDIRCFWSSHRGGWRVKVVQTAVALVLLAFPRALFAKDMTIAVYVEGADAAATRNALLTDVPAGTTVAEPETFSTALSQHGQKLPFGKALEGEARDRIVTRVRTALAASGLDAALIARVIKEKGQRAVKLVLIGASRGDSPRDGEVILGAKKSRDDASKLKAFVDSALGSPPSEATASEKPAAPEKAQETAAPAAAAAAPEAASQPAAEGAAPASPDSTSEHARGSIGKALFEVEVGTEAAGRNFVYNDGISQNLRSFTAFPMAMLKVNAEGFPLGDSATFLRDLGIVGSYARSLFLTSAVQSGSNIDTTESSYFIGLRFRIHPTSDPGLIIGVSDGYASQGVSFGSTTAVITSQIPAVSCSGNRLAVDARIPVGRLSLRAAVGYRAIFDSGTISGRFRGSSAGGIDAEAGAAFELARGWEVRAIADYERYFYSFKPVPGDAYVAGGALDQFFGGRLALAYIY
jgi:hypothetical protein